MKEKEFSHMFLLLLIMIFFSQNLIKIDFNMFLSLLMRFTLVQSISGQWV
jgi:hypothetical protein